MRWLVLIAGLLAALIIAVQFGVDDTTPEPQILANSAASANEFARESSAAAEPVTSHTLRGRVVAPSGESLRNASVHAWIASDAEGCAAVGEGSSVQTDGSGVFALTLADDQLYCVQAQHEDWAASDAQLIAGMDAGSIEMNLVLSVPHIVSGTVVGVSPEQISGLKLALQRPSHQGVRAAVIDANGRFEIRGLDSGRYELRSADARYVVEEPTHVVIADESISDLRVQIFAAATINGRVTARSGMPAAGAMVQAYAPYAPDEPLGSARTAADGSFALVSMHNSERAQNARRMFLGASGFEGRPTRTLSTAKPVSLCLSISHPQFEQRDVVIAPVDSMIDVGSIALAESTDRVRGSVSNHRGEPTRATLLFRRIEQTPSEECGGFAMVEVRTDAAGRFETRLPAAQHEVEVRTERYLPQTLAVDLTTAPAEITLKLK